MKADFHLHSSFSGDSQTPQEAVIAAGISQGLSALCFTDHMDADYPCTDVSFELDTENYLASVRELQQRYSGKLSIGAGVELGLQPHLGDYYRSYTRQYDFDFIIGSTHLVDRYDPYYPEFWNIYNKKEGVLRFLEITLENIQAFDSFDVYGHLDYIVRYVPGEDRSFPYADYADLTDEILRLLISTGKGIEINTAGYKAGLGVPNPCPDILKRYRELGGEIITMGSDAHTAEYVGSCMEKAQELLRSCGFRYFTIFKNRKPEFLPL
jgi:histidinol-phosphatase (PHP family)